jgi:hypothetical protein
VDRNVQRLTEKLVVTRLVSVLKSPPSADVIHKDGPIVTFSISNVVEKGGKTWTVAQFQSASSYVSVGSDESKASMSCIFKNGSSLGLD